MTKRTAKVLPESYKPTQNEMAEDQSIAASPGQLARAVMRSVNVVKKSVSKHRKGRS